MKILLISLQKDLDTIGLKYIHHTLLNKGHDSILLYLPLFNNSERQLRIIKNFVLQEKPNLIGISLMSTEYFKARCLTEFLKSFAMEIPIIWGGIHPTISPESCLDYSDYVCIGEGERTMVDIAEAISEGKNIKIINNLCYIDNSNINKNSLYPPIADLDSLSYCQHFPQRAFILNGKEIIHLNGNIFRRYSRYRGRIYSIIATRGCPFCCSYCCNNIISRIYGYSQIRIRSVKNIIDDVNLAVNENPQLEYVNFQDDCFLAVSEDYLSEFCALYKKLVDKPFIVRSIPTYVNREKVRLLKDAGLSWISLGLQSGSDYVCKEIYKRSSLKSDFIKAAEIIKNFNLATFYDVITDNPFENNDDRFATIDVLSKAPKPFYLQMFSLALYPGTELYLKAKSEFPEVAESYLKKDYLVSRKDTLNSLIRLAPVLNRKQMDLIVDLYKNNPESIKFKALFYLLYLLGVFVLEPVSYFRVIRISQRGSGIKTIKLLPAYLREGFIRYRNRFKYDKISLGKNQN